MPICREESGAGSVRIRRLLGKGVDRLLWQVSGHSSRFWDLHYRAGGTSGPGSIGKLRSYKSSFINDFVARNDIQRVVEFGCGNGDQLEEAAYPNYVGLDVSDAVIEKISSRFAKDNTKSFFVYRPRGFTDNCGLFQADLTLSLDVIFHLVEDDIYEKYIEHLFGSSTKWVLIYSSNIDEVVTDVRYVRHRRFTDDIERIGGWRLALQESNPLSNSTRSQFYLYDRMPHETQLLQQDSWAEG